MTTLAEPAMQIIDALEDAAEQIEHEARQVRQHLAHDGFSAAELKVMRRLLAEKQAFYTQSHLVGLALEQWLDDTAPIAVTTQGVYAAIAALQAAEGDLTRVAAVAEKIEQALAIVVKTAKQLRLALV